MFCANDNGSPQQMLPILLQAVYDAKKFLTSDAVTPLGIRKSATRIAYYAELSVLLLLEHGTQSRV